MALNSTRVRVRLIEKPYIFFSGRRARTNIKLKVRDRERLIVGVSVSVRTGVKVRIGSESGSVSWLESS